MNGELDAIPACSQPVNADLAINWKNIRKNQNNKKQCQQAKTAVQQLTNISQQN